MCAMRRMLFEVAFSEKWGRQMRFISGPRQVGKTTMARQQLKAAGNSKLYYLWDLRAIRQRFRDSELFFTADAPLRNEPQWICYDEIHKFPRWKNVLKATFDQVSEQYRFIVTGSAKLATVSRGGDSLAGRYFSFFLHPLTLAEADDSFAPVSVPDSGMAFVRSAMDSGEARAEAMENLLLFGGFPEPFLKASRSFYAKWSRDYADAVIREDIGALTRIIDREYIRHAYDLIPGLIGSPVSESSLASHIQVSPKTAKSYLRRLEDFCLVFSISPYSRNVKRSLLKARKYYMFDHSQVSDAGARFENFVANELYARTTLWSDLSGDLFTLTYIRDKEKRETDFLIVRNRQPWLLVEAKLNDGAIEAHHYRTQHALGDIPLVQVCCSPGHCMLQTKSSFRISASRIFK